ncbi:hypothetical protein BGZ47_009675 [Haplosporangium gracile]|nr:hypothetical protein BGZ47_009675 [Haplosporangium gracile]
MVLSVLWINIRILPIMPTGTFYQKAQFQKGDKPKINRAAIGNGVAEGLVGIAVVALLVVRRRHQKQNQKHKEPKESKAVP